MLPCVVSDVEEMQTTIPVNRRITRNALRCGGCLDVIESKWRWDFVTCSCGAWSVDGGLDYIRRSFVDRPFVDCEDLTTYEPPLSENDGTPI